MPGKLMRGDCHVSGDVACPDPPTGSTALCLVQAVPPDAFILPRSPAVSALCVLWCSHRRAALERRRFTGEGQSCRGRFGFVLSAARHLCPPSHQTSPPLSCHICLRQPTVFNSTELEYGVSRTGYAHCSTGRSNIDEYNWVLKSKQIALCLSCKLKIAVKKSFLDLFRLFFSYTL